MTTLYLCGAGNAEGVRLAQRVAAATQRWDRIALLDDDETKFGQEVLGVPIVGPIAALAAAAPGDEAANLVARKTRTRAAVRGRIAQSGVPLANLVHPAVDAADCALGRGVLVYEQAILSPGTSLGDGSCVLMRGLVGHGSAVADDVVIAPGAVLNARVHIGSRVYVGSNASVLPEVTVGDDATIGANTMVAQDVPAGASVVGVPGQILAAAEPSAPAVPAFGATAIEARLLEALHHVLGDDRATSSDNFFDVGGTSLRALQFVEAARRAIGIDVPLQAIYACGSMHRLAEMLGGARGSGISAAIARARLRRSLAARVG
ncbi:MAG: phosphopantetheine-binding protein [Planctomycetota bacterium]